MLGGPADAFGAPVLKMPAALDQKLTSKTGAITTPELDTIEAVAKAFSQACGKVPNGLWNPEQETALEALYTRCATLIPKLDAATNMFETTVHVVRRERFEDEVQLLRTRTNALGDFIEGDKHESVVTLW